MIPVKIRQCIAFIVAPLVPSLLFILLALVARPADGFWVAKFALPFTIGTTLISGVPLHIMFSRMGWTSRWAYASIGVVCGLLAAIFLFATTIVDAMTSHQSSPWFATAAFTLIFCVLGALSGLIFWVIARPDIPLVEELAKRRSSE